MNNSFVENFASTFFYDVLSLQLVIGLVVLKLDAVTKMSTATLAAAISLAAIFGAVLLWAAVYYLHRYIHRECCRAKDIFTGIVWAVPKQEDHGNERGEETVGHGTPEGWSREAERRRASEIEWHQRERETEGRKQEREARKDKIRRKVEQWEDSDVAEAGTSFISKTYMVPSLRQHPLDQEREVGGGRGISLQPWVPAYVPAFGSVMQPYGIPYVPSDLPRPVLSLDVERGGRANYQQVEYQLPPPPQPYENMEQPISPSQPYMSEEDPVSQILKSGADEENLSANAYQPAASQEPRRGPDIINICNEYPRLVHENLEAKKKARRREKEKRRAVSYDSSLTGICSSSADEEVPRGPILTATQRPAFHFPQTPWGMSPANIPTSYPMQW
jgi:hypothetical protein